MSHDPEPPPVGQPITDLDRYDARQAALYAALAQYQHAASGEAVVHPGAFGLAVYHELERLESETTLRAVLVHTEGGSISSGSAAFGQIAKDLFSLADQLTRFVLGIPQPPAPAAVPAPPAPAQAEEPEPQPVCPMPKLVLPAQQPEPAAPEPEPAKQPDVTDTDDVPTPEEVEATLGALDALHHRDPDALAALLKTYKAEQQLGRTPVAKSFTTRARLDAVAKLLAEVEA
jgi:hypothetical protein